jgi:hypothetical protein
MIYPFAFASRFPLSLICGSVSYLLRVPFHFLCSLGTLIILPLLQCYFDSSAVRKYAQAPAFDILPCLLECVTHPKTEDKNCREEQDRSYVTQMTSWVNVIRQSARKLAG